MGVCRADERLKPLLTLNVSCAAAADHFISHLSQHFEVSEVGMLARCTCVPLISLRAGRVDRHGPLLCPTTISFGTPTASWRPIMREGYSELVQQFYCRTERGCEFVKLRYRRWLWWTMFGMVITVLQFVLTLYLMCIIMKDFSARGSSKRCFSARQMQMPGRSRVHRQ